MSEALSRRAWVFAGLAIVCWSTAATAFKLALQQLDFLSLVFWASIFSTLSLFLIVLLRGNLTEIRNFSKKDYLRSIGLGALNPAIYYLLLFKAYSLLAAQQAQVLNFIWPMILTILSALFYRERVRPLAWLALLVSFAGVALIASNGQGLSFGGASPLGIILALISAFVWALYWLLNRNDQQDPVLRLWLNFTFGSLSLLVLISIQGHWVLPSLAGLVGALYIALFEMSLAFVFWLMALKAANDTAPLSNFIFITPFLSLLCITLVLGEAIQATTLMGLLLIIVGIFLQKSKKSA